MFLNFACVGLAAVETVKSPTWSREGSERLVQVRSMESASSVPSTGATFRGVSRVMYVSMPSSSGECTRRSR